MFSQLNNGIFFILIPFMFNPETVNSVICSTYLKRCSLGSSVWCCPEYPWICGNDTFSCNYVSMPTFHTPSLTTHTPKPDRTLHSSFSGYVIGSLIAFCVIAIVGLTLICFYVQTSSERRKSLCPFSASINNRRLARESSQQVPREPGQVILNIGDNLPLAIIPTIPEIPSPPPSYKVATDGRLPKYELEIPAPPSYNITIKNLLPVYRLESPPVTAMVAHQ